MPSIPRKPPITRLNAHSNSAADMTSLELYAERYVHV